MTSIESELSVGQPVPLAETETKVTTPEPVQQSTLAQVKELGSNALRAVLATPWSEYARHLPF